MREVASVGLPLPVLELIYNFTERHSVNKDTSYVLIVYAFLVIDYDPMPHCSIADCYSVEFLIVTILRCL